MNSGFNYIFLKKALAVLMLSLSWTAKASLKVCPAADLFDKKKAGKSWLIGSISKSEVQVLMLWYKCKRVNCVSYVKCQVCIQALTKSLAKNGYYRRRSLPLHKYVEHIWCGGRQNYLQIVETAETGKFVTPIPTLTYRIQRTCIFAINYKIWMI